ncbi:MAG: GNAT family N-acetyltransferase [Gemmataceae bacterium]
MPMDRQPQLQGQLLLLRPLLASDYDDLFAVAADPFIWEQHPDSDRYQPEVFQRFFQDALACGGALLAIDLRTGRVIGSSRFDYYDETSSEVEIGWTFLARSHWGGAYNGEMKQLMLHHAFQYVQQVLFLIGPNNLRSRRAIEKIGGELIGRNQNPARRDSVVYRIMNPGLTS